LAGNPSTKSTAVRSIGWQSIVAGAVQRLDPSATVTVCRGGATSARFYLGNMGNVGTGTYGLRIRLSTSAPPAGYTVGGTVVQTFTHSLGAFTQGTFTLPFTVPAGLPNGIYNVYLDGAARRG
jgi:hypothetical protein